MRANLGWGKPQKRSDGASVSFQGLFLLGDELATRRPASPLYWCLGGTRGGSARPTARPGGPELHRSIGTHQARRAGRRAAARGAAAAQRGPESAENESPQWLAARALADAGADGCRPPWGSAGAIPAVYGRALSDGRPQRGQQPQTGPWLVSRGVAWERRGHQRRAARRPPLPQIADVRRELGGLPHNTWGQTPSALLYTFQRLYVALEGGIHVVRLRKHASWRNASSGAAGAPKADQQAIHLRPHNAAAFGMNAAVRSTRSTFDRGEYCDSCGLWLPAEARAQLVAATYVKLLALRPGEDGALLGGDKRSHDTQVANILRSTHALIAPTTLVRSIRTWGWSSQLWNTFPFYTTPRAAKGQAERATAAVGGAAAAAGSGSAATAAGQELRVDATRTAWCKSPFLTSSNKKPAWLLRHEQTRHEAAEAAKRMAKRMATLDDTFAALSVSGGFPVAEVAAAFGRWAERQQATPVLWDAMNCALSPRSLLANCTAAAGAVGFGGVLRGPVEQVSADYADSRPQGQRERVGNVAVRVRRARGVAIGMARAVARQLGGFAVLSSPVVDASLLRADVARSAPAAPVTKAAALTPATGGSVGSTAAPDSELTPSAALGGGGAGSAYQANQAEAQQLLAVRARQAEQSKLAAQVRAELIVSTHRLAAKHRAQTTAAGNFYAAVLEGADEVVDDLLTRSFTRRIGGGTVEQAWLARQAERVGVALDGAVAMSPLAASSYAEYTHCVQVPPSHTFLRSPHPHSHPPSCPRTPLVPALSFPPALMPAPSLPPSLPPSLTSSLPPRASRSYHFI